MEYRRFQNKVFVRIDRGEEILEQLKKLCEAGRVEKTGKGRYRLCP